MEKARSLLEADSNLDEMEDDPRDPAQRFDKPQLERHDLELERPHVERHYPPSPSGVVPAMTSERTSDPGARPRAGAFESGVFAGISSGASAGGAGAASGGATGDRLVDSLQGALGAASRNEANLGSLQRAIRDASRAFTASRQAQEAVAEELRVMHRGLNELMSEKAAVERYAALLTQERDAALDAAEEARREAKREREFLLREQDRFIQLLLEEHEAEVQQLRRSLTQSRVSVTGAEASRADVSPATVPGVAPAAVDQPVFEGRRSSPPGEPVFELGERRSSPPGELGERRSSPPGELSGAALARQALANSAPEPTRAVPLPSDHADAPADADERSPTYPPAPAVLDLDSLAAEIDGNSERPPPIRRLGLAEFGLAEPVLHLRPARVPTQLFDTLVSPPGEVDPNRKG